MMNLLENFRSPQVTRTVWHSRAAQSRWEPIIQRISSEWCKAELESVRAGIRPASRQPVRAGFEYERIVQWARNHGLSVMPIMQVGYFDGFAHSYSSGSDMFVTAVGHRPDQIVDGDTVDRNLGYPECCFEWFSTVFPRFLDPMWQWSETARRRPVLNVFKGTHVQEKAERRHIELNPWTNPLLRYISVRLVPHIPCSVDCQESERLARQMGELLTPETKQDALELLSQPMTWDCYRGVAIITTKDFRVVVGSCAAAERYIIEAN